MAVLVVDYETLKTVRGARILNRAIRLNTVDLLPDLGQKVEAFMLAIGGTWVAEKGQWEFKRHPLAAIGYAIVKDKIICLPASPTT